MKKDILFLHSTDGDRLAVLRNAIIAVIDESAVSLSYKRNGCYIIVMSGKMLPVSESYDTVMGMWIIEPEQMGVKAIEKIAIDNMD